ncbi:MAG TPA: helix-turn-helix domain-containing protein [Rickettsia endosymbiont of Pyrocoelia pectoralis]|nr:helix-turn-helix domain-containing protein [Rickettsia endosymbiont of Pyrocoelia pectoralis]
MTLISKIQAFLQKKSIQKDKVIRKDFKKNSGISKTTVSNIINASQLNPDLFTILKIAKYFGCTIDEVLGRKKQYYDKLTNYKFNDISLDEVYNNLRSFINNELEKNKDLNPYELSENCGFSPNAIRNFIKEDNPQKVLGISIILALADYLEVSIDIMIGRVSPQGQKSSPNSHN